MIDTAAAGEDEILKVHEALEQLREIDARALSVVEMRYFAGMLEAEIAAVLGVRRRREHDDV